MDMEFANAQEVTTPDAVEEAPPAQPVVESSVVEPQPVQEVGVAQTSSAEIEWLRTQLAQATEHIRELQSRLEEYETAAMDDEERARWELDKRRRELEEQQQQLAEMQYAQQLYSYYSRFVPANVIRGQSPAEWQHSVLTHLTSEITRLRRENEALRRSAAPGQGAPRVGSVESGKSASRKTIWQMTPEERQRLLERARAGLTTPEDYPPLE
jgi:hypothetical protein